MAGLKRFKNLTRDLLLISVAFLFVNMGWGIAWPQLPNYMKYLGGGFIAIALLSILFNIFSSIGQYFWGRQSDRIQRRKPFLLFGVGVGGLFFFFMAFATSAAMLLSLRAMQGFFMSAQTPAVSALISEISTNVGRGFAVFNVLSQIGFMIGSFMGGFVIHAFPPKTRFAALYVTSIFPFIIAILLLLKLKEKQKIPMDFRLLFRFDRPGRLILRWGNARKFVKRNKNITIMSISIFVLMISSAMVYSFISVLIKNRFGEGWAGWYFGFDSGFSLIFIYLMGYIADRIGSKPVIVMGLLGYALTYFLYFRATTIPILILAALVSGFKWAAYFNSINTYVARMSLREERATALGLMNSAMAVGWATGPLIGAYLISLVGLATTMLMAIIPVALSLLIASLVENDINYKDGAPVKNRASQN